MHPERALFNIVDREFREGRHTRFAAARKGWLPGVLKTPCDPRGCADTRCLVGMIAYAAFLLEPRYGRVGTMSAAERIYYLLEIQARVKGYRSIRALNDWGRAHTIRDVLRAVSIYV